MKSLTLAMWYKSLKKAVLNQTCSSENAVNGTNLSDLSAKDQIYEQYLKPYEKGAFICIKENAQTDRSILPNNYFSGGFSVNSSILTVAPVFSGGNKTHSLKRVFTRFRTALTLMGASLTTMTGLATTPPQLPELSLPSWNIAESVANTPTNILGNTALSNTNKIPLLEVLRRSHPDPDFYETVIIQERDFTAAGVPGILAWNALAKPDSDIFDIIVSGKHKGLRLIDPNVPPPLEMALDEVLSEHFKRAQSSIIADLHRRDPAAGLLSMIFEIERLFRSCPEVPDNLLEENDDISHLNRAVSYLFGNLNLGRDGRSGELKLFDVFDKNNNEISMKRILTIIPLLEDIDSSEFKNAIIGRLNNKQLQDLKRALLALSIDYNTPLEKLSKDELAKRSESWTYLSNISRKESFLLFETLKRLKEKTTHTNSLTPTNSSILPHL